MWICFNDAFISAVEDRANPDMLKVRAREREHLTKLFPDEALWTSHRTDYRYRVFVTKKAFAKMLAKRAMEIRYDNFKDSVADKDLHDLYLNFWQLHHEYQFRRQRKKRRQPWQDLLRQMNVTPPKDT